MNIKDSEKSMSESNNVKNTSKELPKIQPHKPITNNFEKKKFSLLDFFTKR